MIIGNDHAMLCFVMLCYVMLCYVIVMLCYVMLLLLPNFYNYYNNLVYRFQGHIKQGVTNLSYRHHQNTFCTLSCYSGVC